MRRKSAFYGFFLLVFVIRASAASIVSDEALFLRNLGITHVEGSAVILLRDSEGYACFELVQDTNYSHHLRAKANYSCLLPTSASLCCMTCDSVTVCAASVSMTCGSCGKGDGGQI